MTRFGYEPEEVDVREKSGRAPLAVLWRGKLMTVKKVQRSFSDREGMHWDVVLRWDRSGSTMAMSLLRVGDRWYCES